MKSIYLLLLIFILSQCKAPITSYYTFHGDKHDCYTSIKKALKNIEAIRCLDFSQEQGVAIDNRLLEFKNLKKLDISDLNLKELPSVIFQLPSIEILIVENNKISNISSDIEKLINLKELYISNNPIIELPVELNKLEKLKIIRATNIGFNDEEIKNLKKNVPEGCHLFLDEIMIDYFPPYNNDSVIIRNK